jgi:hypothetical protein
MLKLFFQRLAELRDEPAEQPETEREAATRAVTGEAVPETLPANTAALWGAFLHEGLMISARDPARPLRVLEAWGDGCLELLTEACSGLETIWQARCAYQGRPSFPGIFEYEVVSEIGRALGDYVLAYGKLPDEVTQRALIRDQVQTFFARGEPAD